MHGNVFQWVEECYQDSYEGAPTDGSARLVPSCGGLRVSRGGDWQSSPGELRSAGRGWYSSDDRMKIVGFRVARTLTP
jgi:formylglycine-generating enzyme required for sulfatase activity